MMSRNRRYGIWNYIFVYLLRTYMYIHIYIILLWENNIFVLECYFDNTMKNYKEVILWQILKIPSFVYMKGKFVTNISFATVRLIKYSWDRIKCLTSCFIKNIFFLRLLFPWGGNICLYRHNTLNANFLTFSST
jgi:hypothetical protein